MKKTLIVNYKIPDKPTELCELAFKYGTDKCVQVKHPFTPFYYSILNKRKKSVKKIVEIGIGMKRRYSRSPNNTIGASLYMWQDYFPKALIYGADIDPRTMFRDGRIKTFLCDQTNKTDLYKLIATIGSDIDLLIDDASHIPEDQVFTCLTLMPLLNKKVVYIIEDVKDPTIAQRMKKYKCQIVEPATQKYPDDRLIVVRHK